MSERERFMKERDADESESPHLGLKGDKKKKTGSER